MTFEKAVDFILDCEGGLVNDPRDPGGKTAFGISQRAYPHENIETLTRERAAGLYRRDFWERLKLDMMPEDFRLAFFDCAINQGSGFAVMTLQRLLKVKTDGVIGYVTLASLNVSDVQALKREFLKRRMQSYTESKNWPVFGAGWAKRLLNVALS